MFEEGYGNEKVKCYGQKGYHFTGWYEGEKLISEEREYRFKVMSDVEYVARFEDGNEPLEIEDIIYFEQKYHGIAIGAILAIFFIGIITLQRRKRQ